MSRFRPITSGSRPSVSDGVVYLCEILQMEISAWWILTDCLSLWFCKRVIIIKTFERYQNIKAVTSLQRPMFTSKASLGIRAATQFKRDKVSSLFIVKQVPEKWPIRGQYSGHMISIDQSEARRNESCRLNQLGTWLLDAKLTFNLGSSPKISRSNTWGVRVYWKFKWDSLECAAQRKLWICFFKWEAEIII